MLPTDLLTLSKPSDTASFWFIASAAPDKKETRCGMFLKLRLANMNNTNKCALMQINVTIAGCARLVFCPLLGVFFCDDFNRNRISSHSNHEANRSDCFDMLLCIHFMISVHPFPCAAVTSYETRKRSVCAAPPRCAQEKNGCQGGEDGRGHDVRIMSWPSHMGDMAPRHRTSVRF